MAVAPGTLQLLLSDATLSSENDEIDVSVGAGAWLLSGVAAVAVTAIVVAMTRLRRLEL